ncbi:MAG: GHKL domain-containing protein [Lachnospiraceae bacterium]|nr:GHKL domain-containing protein [Lachnospiraceae bacterium]
MFENFDPGYMLVIQEVFICVLLGSMGFAYAQWLKPFVKDNKTAYLTAAVYAVFAVLFNFMEWEDHLTVLPKTILIIIPLLILCYSDHGRNPVQKLFLCTVFFILRWLSIEISSELSFFERDFVFEFRIFRESIKAIVFEFIAWQIIEIAGTLLLLYFAIKMLHRVYKRKSEEMAWKEFIMLLAPASMIMVVKPIIGAYYRLWSDGIGNGSIKENIPGDGYKLMYCLLSYAVLVVVIFFYEQIKNGREETYANELLAHQIDETNHHIERVESLYDDMRSVRHDMGNHLTVLSGLIDSGNCKEASGYLRDLTGRLSEKEPEFKTGNAVTDVILSEYAGQFRGAGLSFECDFRYPKNVPVKAFDLSVILNNGLQNALENGTGFVKLSSFQKGNAYILDIRNGISGKADIDKDSGIPFTSKQGREHGYGIRNIQNVARKYKGDIDIRQISGTGDGTVFVLNVMLAA